MKENFRLDYQGSLARLEANVEEEFMSSLRNACYKERNYRKKCSDVLLIVEMFLILSENCIYVCHSFVAGETLMWRAQAIGNEDQFRKAQGMRTPSCEEFNKYQKVY